MTDEKTITVDENVKECLQRIKNTLPEMSEEQRSKVEPALNYLSDVFEGLSPKPCPDDTRIIIG